jgi:hypothetical protein
MLSVHGPRALFARCQSAASPGYGRELREGATLESRWRHRITIPETLLGCKLLVIDPQVLEQLPGFASAHIWTPSIRSIS